MQNISEFRSAGDTRPVPFQLHGVLVRVHDTGVLLLGESGIGKSECALDLITNGHQLVADDVIEITSRQNVIVGRPPELTRDLLEVRGLGVINVRELFGDSAVCKESVVDLCVELHNTAEVERIGNVIQEQSIAGSSVPKFALPVGSGRNLATLVTTAVRMHRAPGGGDAAMDSLMENHAALLGSRGGHR